MLSSACSLAWGLGVEFFCNMILKYTEPFFPANHNNSVGAVHEIIRMKCADPGTVLSALRRGVI